METTDKPISEQESLRIITQAIESATEGIKDNGFDYLLWGWLVLLSALLHYVLLTIIRYEYSWIVWPIAMPLGGIVSMIYHYKEAKKSRVKTYIDTCMGYLWGAFGVAFFIVIVVLVKHGWDAVYPVFMILYGVGTFVSGGILKFRPLIIGGIICWGCAIAASFFSFETQLLILSLSLIGGYIIPGYILKYKYSKNV